MHVASDTAIMDETVRSPQMPAALFIPPSPSPARSSTEILITIAPTRVPTPERRQEAAPPDAAAAAAQISSLRSALAAAVSNSQSVAASVAVIQAAAESSARAAGSSAASVGASAASVAASAVDMVSSMRVAASSISASAAGVAAAATTAASMASAQMSSARVAIMAAASATSAASAQVAAASTAVASASKSAADAIAAAQLQASVSASMAISMAMAMASGSSATVPSASPTTSSIQMLPNEGASPSPQGIPSAITIIAVAVAIVGSALLTSLGFYLIVRYRRARFGKKGPQQVKELPVDRTEVDVPSSPSFQGLSSISRYATPVEGERGSPEVSASWVAHLAQFSPVGSAEEPPRTFSRNPLGMNPMEEEETAAAQAQAQAQAQPAARGSSVGFVSSLDPGRRDSNWPFSKNN